MTASLGTQHNAIRKAYSRLWDAFVVAANAKTLKAEAAHPQGALVTMRTAEATLLLPAWPYKAVSAHKKVDIAVCVKEHFSDDFQCITKATSQVGYFERGDGARTGIITPLLELHYDFESPVAEAHPIFHAHIDSTNWPVDALQRLGLPGPIQRRPEGAYGYPNARIPTAFMGFAPMLVSLAADHLDAKGFRRVLNEARSADLECTEPDCALLAKRLGGRKPRGHQWYDERYLVHEWCERGTKFRANVPLLKRDFSGPDSASVRRAVMSALAATLKELNIVPGAPRTA
jgi:hypothetical protein